MRTNSIIIFGLLSAILLIFSCIALNAPKFYNELELNTDTHLVSKARLVLRDRNYRK